MKFPKKVYAVADGGEEFFDYSDILGAIVDGGDDEETKVGVYVFVGTAIASRKTRLSKPDPDDREAFFPDEPDDEASEDRDEPAS